MRSLDSWGEMPQATVIDGLRPKYTRRTIASAYREFVKCLHAKHVPLGSLFFSASERRCYLLARRRHIEVESLSVHVELIQTVTADGVRLDGALLPAPETAPRETLSIDAFLCVHGTGSNFYSSSLFNYLREPLHKLGASVVFANTRAHDVINTLSTATGGRLGGAAYEVLDDCRSDLTAWLDLIASRGLTRVVLVGHSLGALKSLYMMAHQPHDAVTGVVAISPPRLSYTSFSEGPEGERFRRDFQTAEDACAAGERGRLLEVTFPIPYVVTTAAYVDKYGPEDRYDLLQFLDRVVSPTMVVFGSEEVQRNVAFRELPEAIERLADGTDRAIQVEVIAGADHFYSASRRELANRTIRWLRQSFAGSSDDKPGLG